MFSERYVDRMISYHAGIFRSLIAGGEIRDEDPDTLAWMYVSPVITLLSVCVAITAVAGKFMIPALHRLHFGQTIREDA